MHQQLYPAKELDPGQDVRVVLIRSGEDGRLAVGTKVTHASENLYGVLKGTSRTTARWYSNVLFYTCFEAVQ